MEEAENRADQKESRGGKKEERKRRKGEECRQGKTFSIQSLHFLVITWHVCSAPPLF